MAKPDLFGSTAYELSIRKELRAACPLVEITTNYVAHSKHWQIRGHQNGEVLISIERAALNLARSEFCKAYSRARLAGILKPRPDVHP